MVDRLDKVLLCRLCLLLSISLVSACATTDSSGKKNVAAMGSSSQSQAGALDGHNEALLQVTENYTGLINLYKKQLETAGSTQEGDMLRLQIADAYLQLDDPESALFYLDAVSEKKSGSAELFLLKSRALLASGKNNDALQAVITAHGFDVDDPVIFNQLGKVQAVMNDYPAARRNFEKARSGMLEDAVVQNNLAMLDILEGHFDSAARRLLILYRSGQADDRIKANLAFSLAKSNRYREFSSIFGAGKKEEERVALFQTLAGSTAIPVSGESE